MGTRPQPLVDSPAVVFGVMAGIFHIAILTLAAAAFLYAPPTVMGTARGAASLLLAVASGMQCCRMLGGRTRPAERRASWLLPGLLRGETAWLATGLLSIGFALAALLPRVG